MTKQQEIEILDFAIRQLGDDSYLGPWLSDVRAEVASLIRSDIFPELSLQRSVFAAVGASKAITAQAKADAESITKLAEKARAKAYNDATAIRNNLADAINQAKRAIQNS